MQKQKTITLATIVAAVAGEVIQEKRQQFNKVKSLSKATADSITFYKNKKYEQDFLQTSAGLVFIEQAVEQLPTDCTIVLVKDSSQAFDYCVHALLAERQPVIKREVASEAVIAESTTCGDNVAIYPRVVIGNNCQIGANTIIHPGVVIYDYVKIGSNCIIHANSVIREGCYLGNHVILQPGAIIGSDGFGYSFDPANGYQLEYQYGNVILEDYVEIGANTTIDRARFSSTKIGKGSKIDNGVQIAHNVSIGQHTLLTAQVGVAGSTEIGNYSVIASQTGIAGHLKIGDKVTVAAQSGVTKNLLSHRQYMGFPAIEAMAYRRQHAKLKQLIKKS